MMAGFEATHPAIFYLRKFNLATVDLPSREPMLLGIIASLIIQCINLYPPSQVIRWIKVLECGSNFRRRR